MGPDKGVEHVLHGLDCLPRHLKDSLVYIIAGEPADCGATCIEYYDLLEVTAAELNLTSTMVLMPEALTQEAWTDVMTAADIAVNIYPEDLFPHPATFMEALAHGVVPIATPFAAALSYMDESAGVLVFERDPVHVAAALRQVLELGPKELAGMQHAAWEASLDKSWEKVGAGFVEKVIGSVVKAATAASDSSHGN